MIPSIEDRFREVKRRGKPALMPYITAGYPDFETFRRVMLALDNNGADFIEVGIPFSDPLADGGVIQKSSQIALQNGVNIENTLSMIKSLKKFQTPIIIMSYFNPIYRYGLSKFISKAAKHKIRGLIIPDLIPEEGLEIEALCMKSGIDLIYLLAPTSSDQRAQLIVQKSSGFVYLVTITGVTGSKIKSYKDLLTWISRIKAISDLPVCAGFGIATTEQARQVAEVADGVIIGSAFIKKISSSASIDEITDKITNFIKALRRSIDRSNMC